MRRAAIDQQGVVECVLELRAKWAEPKKTLGNPPRYDDPKYYAVAAGR
jgi:hypothetical protein